MPDCSPQHTSGQAACADAFYAPIVPIIVELLQQGLSLRRIAAELDRRKVPTRQLLMRWNAAQVGRVLDRAGVARIKRPRLGQQSAPERAVTARAGQHGQEPRGGQKPGRERSAESDRADLPSGIQRGEEARPQVDGSQRGQQPACPPGANTAAGPAIPPRAEKRVYLHLNGYANGPFMPSEVREMLKRSHVGYSTMGRWENTPTWKPLRELLALPEPIQVLRNRNRRDGSS
jgi:hypothetical protein